MYVIFPADEVVYLSYGRLIYVPSSSSPENHLNTAPIRTNSLEESGINLSSELSQSRVDSYNPQSNEKPCTSRTADFGSSKTHSNPDKSKPSQPGLCNSLERPPPHRAINSNSTKSSTSSKKSSGSSKSTTALLECKEPDASSNSNPGTTKKLSGNSFKSFFKSRLNSEKTPESIPVRPERKKDKKLPTERKLSYNDYLTVGRERTEIPRSDIVNTRSDQVQDVKSEKPIKREKSPVFRFFRAQSSSPRTLGCDRTAFDFDGLFRQESNPGKLSVNSVLRRPGVGSESNLTNRQSSEKSPTKKRAFFSSQRTKRSSETEIRMAGNESPLRDLIHPAYNEHLKSHNAVSFKLVRTVSDFTQQLGQMYEQHAEELQLLVANFRKRNGELRKERPACPSSLFHTWETLLQEVEIDSQALGDIASILGRQVSRPLLERSFHRKIQSRKVFTHRESYETIIAKTEEKLAKCRQEYKNAYLSYLSAPSTESLSAYFNTHNAYIQQLHATNGMMEEFGKHTLPSLLQELEEIYTDLCSTVTEAVLQGAEVVSNRATERSRRYESLISQCKAVSGPVDLTHLARSLPAPTGRGPIMKRIFVPPQPPPPPDPIDGEPQDIQVNDNVPPPLRDELVIDRLSAVQIKPSHDALKKESQDLEAQIRQIQDALDTLVRIQQRSVEASLYNKANELQEDISMKRFDLRVAQIHLSAINSQKELFSNKMDGETVGRERKMSSASTGSMKTKWLKAFKSLKTPPPEPEKKNGAAATRELLKGDPDAHNFQEYTYKKITPCDICSQVLRGHTRQGLKCRICKMNVHVDCQDKASKCQTKARLLRRQKSTSEIETRVPELNPDDERIAEVYSMPTINRRLSIRNNNRLCPPPNNNIDLESPEVDQIYQVLKQATEISNSKLRVNVEIVTPVDKSAPGSNAGSSGSSGQSLNRRGPPPQPRAAGSMLAVINPAPCSTSSAPHSPRRQKLNLRMKSLSLDSPESTEHVRRGRHHGANAASDPHSNQSSSSRIQFPQLSSRPVLNRKSRRDVKAKSTPSSPVHNRRLLSAKNIRMSSVELPDDNDKSPSSASTSPCPSPVGAKKSHRLLPTNLYVVLYNFKSRHQDELDLKAGYKVTVIDTSDSDWWKGKCLGRVGFFPSKYVSKLSSGEKPLQVTHNLQVSDGENGLMLLRDQIVIQIGEELDGMVMIRSGDNRQGICPLKFLQEV
ncbi:SH3 and cysteine-rich domain-containing protein isoform X3 [Leptinotarsa decemlineata]|uniref:SH3 and cysteine-rich domain-containing protein isoform X3 n=1 Tax=Leptinotarsa decemlineata TaxID=7539 RepID=UPI003D30C6D0